MARHDSRVVTVGWVAETAAALLGAHTPSKNPRPVSRHKHASLVLLAGESS